MPGSRLVTFARSALPAPVRRAARSVLPMHRINPSIWSELDPFEGTEWEHGHGGSRGPVGILRDFARQHQHYIAACRDLDVAYRVVDLTADDWVDRVRQSACRLFLAWPSVYTTLWKQMFDERVRLLVEDLSLAVYPSLKETWLYESKRRCRDWMEIHGLEHPRTWVFFDEGEALAFVRAAELPLVFKTDLGSSSHGVRILRSRARAEALVRRVFARGVVPDRADPRDRQWGVALFQEYLAGAEEWRLVRIGDSYFCRLKGRRGDFHSGSGKLRWERPPERMLEITREITERAGFSSMNIDFFETPDGRILANELHTVFGVRFITEGLENLGRFLHRGSGWEFEPGDFSANAFANLRLAWALERLLPEEGSRAAAGR